MALITDQDGTVLGSYGGEVPKGKIWVRLSARNFYIKTTEAFSDPPNYMEIITGYAKSKDHQLTWVASHSVDIESHDWKIIKKNNPKTNIPEIFLRAIKSFLAQLRITSVKVE